MAFEDDSLNGVLTRAALGYLNGSNTPNFATGIAYGLTTATADNGTTAVAAGAILGLNVVYV